MKKIITIILIAIIVIPFFPGNEVHASTTKDQRTPGKINSVKQKAIFYAVSEKSGIQFSGANGGANNFFDALRQSNYELYKDDNKKLTKNGEKPATRFEKIVKEFDQKPIKVKPGVGKFIITGYAFSMISDTILNSFETWAYGLSMGYQVKVFDRYIAENSEGPSISEMPGIIEMYTLGGTTGYGIEEYSIYSRTYQTDGTIPRTAFIAGSFKPGTFTHQMNFQRNYTNEWQGKTTYLTDILISGRGEHPETPSKIVTGSKVITIHQSQWNTVVDGSAPIVANKEPKSLGTLNPPDWSNQTEMPDYVELEVPITEDGEVDLDRQLSPENPAVNDPKKPLAPVITDLPDYTVPDEDSGKKPVPTPNLTPKPNPQTNPLPSPSPMPEPTVPDPTVPPAEDTPTTKPKDTQNRWAALVTNKFPFSLPWDIGNMIEPLLADPVRPSVKVDVAFDVFGKSVPIKFSHNFAWMDDFIGFVRIFILIGFNLFMITGTRKLMGGGQ